MSNNQNQRIDLNTLDHDQFITLMYKMWSEQGAAYCNGFMKDISWKIQLLPREKIAKYILKIMQHLGVDHDGLRDLVNKTPVASICSDEGANPSLSLFIGFGNNTSNNGIVKKVNNATSTTLIENYKPPKKTEQPKPEPFLTSFGGGAASPQSMVGVENEKVSTPPPTQKTSSSVRTPSAVSSTNRTNIKDAVHSAIRPTGATPKSGAGMGDVSKALHYDEVPKMVGVGGGNDDGGDGVGSIIGSVVEELSQVTFSEGIAGGGSVEWNGPRIEQELKAGVDKSFVMSSLFGPRSTEQLVTMAKTQGPAILEMITKDKYSENFKNMTFTVSHQESLRAGTATRTEAVQGVLQSNLSIISSKAALEVEKAQQLRDRELKAAQQTHDDTVSKAKRVYDETVAKAALDLTSAQSNIQLEFLAVKDEAEMKAKVVEQELEEWNTKAGSEFDRTKRSNADLIKPKAMIKVIQLGYEMLSYYCEGNTDATSKADVINNQLTEHMQPALEDNDQDAMIKEIINWKAKEIMDL